VTFVLRFVVVTLAAFGFSSAVASIAVSWWMRRALSGDDLGAVSLFQLRLTPAVMSSVVFVLAIASFLQFEPRGGQEHTGMALILVAAIGAAVIATMVVRLARMTRASNQALARWMISAEPITLAGMSIPVYQIDVQFPIVAIAGLFRPRLLIARSVLAACSADELQAILAHERSHLRNSDNVRRLIVAAVPDVLMWTAAARRLARLWQTAAEEAADAEAALTGPASRVSLAEALIRVGRLAPAGSAPADLPVSALFRGENLERRVRRLLDPSVDFARPRRRSSWLLGTAASLLTISVFVLEPIHELVEAAVAFLP
jgi:beta-lactamase regulating signal transducer with metallopeptidase domain